MKGLCLLLFLCSTFYAGPYSYPYRDINQPVIRNSNIEKIVVYSAPRAGSTITYMIFQYLFEDTLKPWFSTNKKVIKTHAINTCKCIHNRFSNVLFVIPIRHPTDAFLSGINLISKNPSSSQAVKLSIKLAKKYNEVYSFIESMSPEKLLVIRYDNFNDNLKWLLNVIKGHFNASITIKEEENIMTVFSKEAQKKTTKKYTNFNAFDQITGIHGHHISTHKSSLDQFPVCSQMEINANLRESIAQYNILTHYIPK